MQFSRKYPDLVILCLISIVALIYNFKQLNEVPANIHAWAQSDRYAIALGFMDNNFDFFHPQTYVLNKQFPGNFKIPSDNAITAVDFPIHDYLVSFIMKIFNTRSPWCFRLYVLIYSIIGMYFLFKISRYSGINYWLSAFLVLFACSSPVFVYYQAGFLPTIPSLTLAIIGFYLYFKYLDSKKSTYFYWTVFFLTIATLTRTTFFLAFATLMAFELLLFLRNRKTELFKIISFSAGLIVIVSYFLYNVYLRKVYGSMFMNRLLPPENLNDVSKILSRTASNWFFHYFSESQYVFLLFSLIFISYYFYKKPSDIKNKSQKLPGNIIFLISIYFLACIFFYIALMRQFPDHDYYFLDTFFLPVILLIIYLFSRIDFAFFIKLKNISIIIAVFVVIFVFNAKITDGIRRETGCWDRTALSIKNFSTAQPFLDSIGISKNAKILVVDATAPNLPFILMDRKGYNSMECSASFFKNSYNWDYDYLIVQTEFLIAEEYKNYPDFINYFEKIADNGYLTVLKKTKKSESQSLEKFLGVDKSSLIFSDSINFDRVYSSNWQNIQTDVNLDSIQGKFGFLNGGNEYGLTFQLKSAELFKSGSTLLKVSALLKESMEKPEGIKLVASVQNEDNILYYQSVDIQYDSLQSADWNPEHFYFIIPKMKEIPLKLAVYLWNLKRSAIYFDDCRIELFLMTP